MKKLMLLAVLVTALLPSAAHAQAPLPYDPLTKKELYLGIASCLMGGKDTSIWISQSKTLLGFFWPDAAKMNFVMIDLAAKNLLPVTGAKNIIGQQISFGEYNDLPSFMRELGFRRLPPYLVPVMVREHIKEWIAIQAQNGIVDVLVIPLWIFLNPPYEYGRS